MIGHDIESIRQRYLLHLHPYSSDQIFDNVTNFVTANPPWLALQTGISPRDECHLEINLRKFRLPILTTILIPEAPGKLIVSVNSTGAHEELLRLLRGLRECEEEGLLDIRRFRPVGESISGRDKELASAFRGRLEKNRCFNFEEI